MRSALLTLASLGLTAAVVGNAWFQRQQFYPSVVYITKSNPSMAVLYIQALVMVILMGKLMRKIFFGQLRAAEFEHLMERSWYAVTETCLAFTVFKDDFSPKFVALFTLLLFLKSFHWLAEERVDFMERSPVITVLFHLRVISLAVVLASLDGFFMQHAYQSTLTKGASVQLVFGFEYAILITIVINTIVKYILHSIDVHGENPWENKAVYMLYAELVIGFVKVLLYVLFFVIMVRIYTLPLFAVRPMYLTMRAFKKAFNDVVLSRRAIHNMNTLYPTATAEELSTTDNICIICREEMVAASTKKLPCNHIFHGNCLRSWFQRQQTCPTCRLDVLRITPVPQQPIPAAGAAAAAVPPQQQVFQQQIQHMRQQLEAMQQRGAAAGGARPPQFGMFGANMPLFPPFGPQQQQQQPPAAAAATAPAAGDSTAAASSTTTSATPTTTAGAATGGAPTAAGVRPPVFLPPPFPFLPFAVPPPLPPPNFQGLSDSELAQMEGNERQNVEARIKCLRNIQVLLDAAVMEMQQYSSVVARCNTNVQQTSSTAATAAATVASTAATAATNSVATSAAASAATVPSSSPPPSSSAPATNTTAPYLTPAETGARPKSSVVSNGVSSVSTASPTGGATLSAALQRAVQQSDETAEAAAAVVKQQPDNSSGAGEKEPFKNDEKGLVREGTKEKETVVDKMDNVAKQEDNPFAVLTETKSPEQEEIRRRRLAVFEEQKKRLAHKK